MWSFTNTAVVAVGISASGANAIGNEGRTYTFDSSSPMGVTFTTLASAASIAHER